MKNKKENELLTLINKNTDDKNICAYIYYNLYKYLNNDTYKEKATQLYLKLYKESKIYKFKSYLDRLKWYKSPVRIEYCN